MNKEVNFETAKLLKEKEFDEPCTYYYELEYAHLYPENTIHTWDPRFKTKFKNSYQWEKAAAPTIADVVMWLYEKHGIWIGVTKYKNHEDDDNDLCYFTPDHGRHVYETPTEAYEARIKFTLENLIQGGNNEP